MGVALGLVCALIILILYLMVDSMRRRSGLPGPRGLPFFGLATTMWRNKTSDVVPLFVKWYKTYGSMFEAEIFGMMYVFLAEPELVEPILTSNVNLTKGFFEYSFFKPMFNDGLIVSDGDKWRSRRKLLTPSFHFKILESSLVGICRNAKEHVSTLLSFEGKPIELEEHILLTALKMICESAMGVAMDTKNERQNEYLKASQLCLEIIVERCLRVWQYPESIFRLCKAGKRFFQNVDITHNFDKQVIRERKKTFQAEKNGSINNESSKNDRKKAFLDTLLELDDTHPGLFSESDILEEVDTFMTAGYHTMTSSIMFSYFVLANYPDIQQKVYDEQMEILGNKERMPTIKDLNKMIYLEMVINETMRIYPSVPFYSRLLREDLRIDENTVIPAGKTVVVFAYGVHRSKKHWPNPEEFIPERFAPGVERHPFSFLPFSAGPRNCLGKKYALVELKALLSIVVRNCRLEPVTTSVELDYGVTMTPTPPFMVKVFPRDSTITSFS